MSKDFMNWITEQLQDIQKHTSDDYAKSKTEHIIRYIKLYNTLNNEGSDKNE